MNASPMTRQEYNTLRGWELPADENGTELGMQLEDIDNDKFTKVLQWLPIEAFNAIYRISETYTDRIAIERSELEVRVTALSNYIADANKDITNVHIRQLSIMKQYLEILKLR